MERKPDADISDDPDTLDDDRRGMKKLLLGLLASMARRQRALREIDEITGSRQDDPED